MLTKKQLDKYANVLLWGLKTARTGAFKKGDIVLVQFQFAALELAEAVHGKLLDMGMHPVMRSGLTPVMEHDFYQKANNKQLVFVGSWQEDLYRKIHGRIFLHAPTSLTHLADIDPKRIGKTAVAMKPLRDIMRKREDRGDLGWTLCTFPTEELARQAGLTMKQYTNQIIKACYLDKPDPVAVWKGVFKDAISIKDWLNSMAVDYYRVESENIDLKITPGDKRKWIGISGHNIPSFELFISPDWRGTEGKYVANQPSFRSGNYVENVRLFFKKGVAVEVEAEKGNEFTKKQLIMDKGARQVGEFSLTDKRFSKINQFMANTLFDENYGGRYGNCHLAVGMSYTDTYDGDTSELTEEMKAQLGFNDSALHWDLVNTEKKMVTAHLATGENVVIYENGMFTL
ncbi:MAG TPA: aminopeptidase [Deltaproteobacteria bacterium]|nr:aminopeptidase [Deltaproteobacteria bacterium]HIJ35786.1 aminopeptidase [Deltaproteobacteria bacterium]HIJ40358.1 aminopeptidase [Deltaproteobacteria bacterium]